MEDRATFEVEELLANQGWVRSLALRLVGDADLADDIVQQTWIAALENPPRSQDTLRGWLSSVVRRLSARAHRDRFLRRKHDLRFVPPEPLAGPAELLELAERHQKIVSLVLELEEPYRSTILRRYFLDMSSEEIARRLGVPAATVRTHLKRALDRLRERLDRENGGDRPKWVRALLPLAAIPAAGGRTAAAASPLPVALGNLLGWAVVLMTSVKIALPVALVAGAAILFIAEPWQGERAGGERPAIARDGALLPDPSTTRGAPGPTSVPPAVDGQPLVRGRLVDQETGDPIAGFPVEIRRSDSGTPAGPEGIPTVVARAITDGRGDFRFDDLAPGEYLVAPGTDERVELRTEPAMITINGSTPATATLTCEVRWFVAGTVVVEGSEEPVPECWLRVVAGDGTLIASGATDEQGSFRLRDSVPRGPARIYASGPLERWFHTVGGEPDGSAQLDLGELVAGEEDVSRLALEHPWNGVLEGIVVDGSRRPVEGATVRVLADESTIGLWEAFWVHTSPSGSSGAPNQITGPDGTFRFARLPADRPLRLAARAPGMAPSLGERGRIGDRARFETVMLDAPGLVRGVVRLADGTPLPGAIVFTYRSDGGPGHGAEPHELGRYQRSHDPTRSDREGRFELAVVPGRHVFGARAPNLLPLEKWRENQVVDVAPGGTVEVEVEMLMGGDLELAGVVVDGSSEPLTRVQVQVVEEESRRPLSSFQWTDEGGRFRFRNLTDGRYRVIVIDSHGVPSPSYPLSIRSESEPFPAGTDGITIVHDPERCRLELHVVDAETGEGLPSYLWCGPPNASGEFEYSAGIGTERDGRRSLVIPPGPYDILVDAAGHEARVERIDFDPDEPDAPPRSLEIRLPRGRVATGVVVDTRGQPVPDVQVGVVFETAARFEVLRNSVVTTGVDGTFTIECLPEQGGRVAVVRRLSVLPGTVTETDREPIRIMLPNDPERGDGGG